MKGLTGKLLAVDGLSTSAVTLGEVTTLKHEVGDNTVERRALITESVLASAEFTEVLSGLGDNVVKELEDDTTLGVTVDGDVELKCKNCISMSTSDPVWQIVRAVKRKQLACSEGRVK